MGIFAEKKPKWRILIALTICISMTFVDISILPVTLPTIQRDLGLSELSLQWIINGYILALTIFVLAGGRIGDKFGHKKTFCWGLFFFILGSILCGMSYQSWEFISARVIQGLGGAMLIPTSAAIIFNAFPTNQRGKAIGIYTSVGYIFFSLGPFIGGIFTQYISWRLVFWINIPIAIVGYLLTLYTVPKTPGTDRKFDFVGFITSSLGITCIIVPLMQAKQWGWLSPITLGMISVGILFLILLIMVDRQIEDPYIDFSLFKKPNYAGALACVFLIRFTLMITVFWAIYFQNVFQYTPVGAGTLTLLSNVPLMIAAALGGYLIDKKGQRLPILLGFGLIAASIFWFLQNIENPNLLVILSAIIPFSFGIPLILNTGLIAALEIVDSERRGLASATSTMIRQFGGTLGLAILGALFINIKQGQFAADLLQNKETLSINPIQFEGLLSKAPKALEAINKLSPSTQSYVSQAYVHSYISGFKALNLIGFFLAIIGFILAFFLIRKEKLK